jgi:2'-5' RNA ligase
MRLFFALPIAPSLQLQIDQWCDQELATSGDRVPIGNFHLTLAFLGELQSSCLERLCLLCEEALSSIAPPAPSTLEIDQFGFWPRPRVFWIGPSQWPDLLTRMAAKLAQAGSIVGARKSRQPYSPHITVVRHCTAAPPPLHRPNLLIPIDQVTLFESVPTRHGVRYQALEQWSLPQHGTGHFPDRPSLPCRRRSQ